MNEIYGDGIKDIIFGRANYPPKVRNYLKQNGNNQIVGLKLYRAPIESSIKTLLNYATLGQIERNVKNLGYDNIYHLALHFTLDNGNQGLLEKNHVIEINNYKHKEDSEEIDVYFYNYLTLNILMNNASKLYKNITEMNDYDIKNNNCQRFIYSILEGSKLLTDKNYQFIMQNADKLLQKTGKLKTLSDILTTTANRLDVAVFGAQL